MAHRALVLLTVLSLVSYMLPVPQRSHAAWVPGSYERVSVSSTGAEANGEGCYYATMSADGRYVAFESYATSLVSGDTTTSPDILVRDRQTGTTERISVSTTGGEPDGASNYPYISSNGRFVAFESDATNLVEGDTNSATDIFVYDRQTQATERVSVSSTGEQGNSASAWTSISADGRYVAFRSDATNLVPGDTNGAADVFVHDRQAHTTVRVSVATDGTQGNNWSNPWWTIPTMSADGRYVAFSSHATNLVAGDTNARSDVFVRDRDLDADGTYDETGSVSTFMISLSSSNAQGNGLSDGPFISADGRYVAFYSYASNLVTGDTNAEWDVFVRDTVTGTTERVSISTSGVEGNDGSAYDGLMPITMSADGRYVGFWTTATNLVDGAAGGIIRDRLTGETTGFDGSTPFFSSDSRLIAFSSQASTLVSGDTNGVWDVFVAEMASTQSGGGSAPAPAPDTTVAIIDPAKTETVQDSDGSFQLEVPAGAIDAPDGASVELSVTEMTGSEANQALNDIAVPDGLMPVGKAFEFKAEARKGSEITPITTFLAPLNLTLTLTADDLKGVVNPEKLALFKVTKSGNLILAGGKFANGKLVVKMRGFSTYVLAEVNRSFIDTASHWAKGDIELMASKYIAKGRANGTFNPEGEVTRAEFASMLARAMELPAVKSATLFKDVRPGDWFASEVAAAADAGVVSGFKNGVFKPGERLTREQAAAMLARSLKASGKAGAISSGEINKALGAFVDRQKVSDWASSDVATAIRQGIVGGRTPTQLCPQEGCSRAEAVAMIARYWKK